MEKQGKQWYLDSNVVLYSLVAGSGLVVILTSGRTDKVAVSAFQFAYSILFWVVCYKTLIAGINADFTRSEGFLAKGISFVMMFLPFLRIIAVILWILTLVYLYYDRITGGNVSDYYTPFMNIASIMLLIQIYMIFSETSDKNASLSLKTYSVLRMLSILAVFSVITVSIVLKFYITDC